MTPGQMVSTYRYRESKLRFPQRGNTNVKITYTLGMHSLKP